MTAVNKYRIYCLTDSKNEYSWGTVEPTVCPVNTAHSIDAALTTIVEQTSTQLVTTTGPKTSDGKDIVTSAVFPGNQNPQYPGVGDDIANAVRGAGPSFLIDAQKVGDTILDVQFIDTIYIASGEAYTYGGKSGDTVTFDLVFPATPVTSTPGTGNCNLSDGGGAFPAAILITPAAGDGSHTVDLTAALNANLATKPRGTPSLVTKACPVPAFADDGSGNGYWDWDEPTGALTASATPGLASWHLFSAEMTEVRYVPKMQLAVVPGGSKRLAIEVATKAKKILPHWVFRVTVSTIDAANLTHLDWFFKIGRKVMV